jgi:hypothetical protein
MVLNDRILYSYLCLGFLSVSERIQNTIGTVPSGGVQGMHLAGIHHSVRSRPSMDKIGR